MHPSKLEVRFSKEQELLQFIEETLHKALREQVFIPQGRSGADTKKAAAVQEQLDWSAAEKQDVSANDRITGTKKSPSSYEPWNDSVHRSGQIKEATEVFMRVGEGTHVQYANETNNTSNVQSSTQSSHHAFPFLYPIGQMRGTYIIAQNEDGLYLIDQHAAHERIHYEYYYERFGRPDQVSQDLLVPITLEFTPSEASVIKERLPYFEQAGVYIEFFGGNSFIVRSHPQWLPAGEEKISLKRWQNGFLTERKAIDIAKLREQTSIMCSCKAAIKANHHLKHGRNRSAVRQLQQCNNPYTCPHGRPIIISYSNYELEKMFKRV